MNSELRNNTSTLDTSSLRLAPLAQGSGQADPEIKVRAWGSTYIANGRGKYGDIKASCTVSPEEAAERCAVKMGFNAVALLREVVFGVWIYKALRV